MLEISVKIFLLRNSRSTEGWPENAFDGSELSTQNKEATYDDLGKANKVLKKAQSEKASIGYRKLGDWKDLKIVTYTDSSCRNMEDTMKSVSGQFIAIENEKGDINTLAWKSKTIQQICKSVKTAETQCLELGMEYSIYMARIFSEIYTGMLGGQITVQMKIDSKTLKDSI